MKYIIPISNWTYYQFSCWHLYTKALTLRVTPFALQSKASFDGGKILYLTEFVFRGMGIGALFSETSGRLYHKNLGSGDVEH